MERQKSDYLFLTLTFKKDSVGIKPDYQFHATINTIFTYLIKSVECFDINPELTVAGTIHYHIFIIAIKDKVKWYKQTLPALKRLGYIDIQTVKCATKCKEYTRKDNKLMEKILKVSLPITETDKQYELRSVNQARLEFGRPPDKTEPNNILDRLVARVVVEEDEKYLLVPYTC